MVLLVDPVDNLFLRGIAADWVALELMNTCVVVLFNGSEQLC